MKTTVQHLILWLGLALFVVSCSPKDRLPKNILSVEEMSAMLLDFELATAYNPSYFSQSSSDTSYPTDQDQRLKIFYQQIFELHDIDTGTFFSSYRYYTTHPDWIKKVYTAMEDSIDYRLDIFQARTRKKRLEEERKKQPQLFLSFWEKDLEQLNAFYDTLQHTYSQVIIPWKKEDPAPQDPPQRIWRQHYLLLHQFYDSLYQQYSPLIIPGKGKD